MTGAATAPWPTMSGAHRIAVAALAAALLAFALERGLVVARVAENWTRDLRVATLSPRLPRSEEVVAVRISEDSLAPLPYRSPVDRMFLAGLVETLADKGVRAIGVDLLIDQPTEPGKDAALRTAIDAAGVPVVMAWASPAEGLTQSQARWLDGYLEGLRRGSTVVHADPADGIVRSLPLAPSTPGAPPGLVAAIANAVGLEVPGAPVLKIDYRRGPAADQAFIASYPAHAVAVLPQAWLRGRIALIGVDLALADRHRTPLSALAAHGPGDVSGVMIHAQAMAQILDGRRLSEPRAATQLALLLVAALAGSLLSMVPAPLWAMLALDAMALALIWSGAFWLFGAGGPLVPVVAPSLALTAGTGIAAAFRLRGERATRRFVERAFSKYLAPEVVSRLVAQPDRLTVGGERRVVTFLFTDVADFTTLVEGMEPAPLVDLLNEYLDGACRLVMDHGGTIDKIVGDALHVMFNAPEDQPDHALRAVRCARALDGFSRRFIERQRAWGVDFGATRIGVHTGPVVVGNFGGAERFDYTAHGDAINTAARLEGANKHLGTRVLVSASCAEACAEPDFRPVGHLVLKGKQRGIEVFEPVAIDGPAGCAPPARYREAYQLVESGDPRAAVAFARLAAQFPGDSLVAFQARRLTEGRAGTMIELRDK